MKTTIGIRVSDKIKKRLQDLADREHRTLSNYVYKLLVEHIEAMDLDPPRQDG